MPIDDLTEGTEVQEVETGSTSAQESTTPTPSTGIDFDLDKLLSLPADKLSSALEKNPEFYRSVTKNIRLSDINKRAEERAAALSNERVQSVQTQLQTLQQERDAMLAEREQQRLSTMSDEEQKIYWASKQIGTYQQRTQVLEHQLKQIREDEAKQSLLDHARGKWGLDDEDIETLRKESDAQIWVDKAMTLSANRRQKQMSELTTVKEQLAAIQRQINGTSTFAATSPAAAGSDQSFEELEDLYGRDASPAIAARYYEARKKRGL